MEYNQKPQQQQQNRWKGGVRPPVSAAAPKRVQCKQKKEENGGERKEDLIPCVETADRRHLETRAHHSPSRGDRLVGLRRRVTHRARRQRTRRQRSSPW
mmetsp:Transcript_77173/g.89797  ORF Transcript_77173/g.89797 Transcript_77173/m.89797 type:complete len:99 (+) Transcript_77173:557-853(+)